jgi:hypothetical protein
MEKSKKKIIWQALIFVVTFVVAFFATQYLMSDSSAVDKELKAVAEEMNKSCPMMIDKNTRLDNTIALKNNTLQYNYTLLQIEKGAKDVNVEDIKKYIMSKSQENLNTNPEMNYYREKNTALKYYYKDKNGKYLLDFTITPEKKQQ